jgi:hypothetical protein
MLLSQIPPFANHDSATDRDKERFSQFLLENTRVIWDLLSIAVDEVVVMVCVVDAAECVAVVVGCAEVVVPRVGVVVEPLEVNITNENLISCI